MRLLSELMTTDVGLMSAAGIFITLGIGAYILRYFMRHVRGDEARARRGRP